MMIRRFLCLILLLLCPALALAEMNADYEPYTFPLKVNAKWYTGKAAIRAEDGTICLPLDALSLALGIDLPAASGDAVSFNGQTLDAGAFVSFGGSLYAQPETLKALSLNVYMNGESISYIDNFKALDYTWAQGNRVVAHALGGYENSAYVNSREAFLHNYERGYRVFEVDFLLSADEIPVAAHEWRDVYLMQYRDRAEGDEPYPPLTVEEFTGEYLLESQTGMTIDDVVQLMIEYPDIYMVTDTKETLETGLLIVFEEIIAAAEYYDPAVLDRFIPQIYNFDMYDPLFELYDWKSAIFTMYRVGSSVSPADVFDFTYQRGIKAITAPSNRSPNDFCAAVLESGGYVYLHTYNTLGEIDRLAKRSDIYGVYSDFLDPHVFDGMPVPLVIPQDALDAEAASAEYAE